MKINDMYFNTELEDILTELQKQLALNGIPYLQKFNPTTSDIMVQCPYHNGGQERRPSAGIRKSDGLFHCLACNETHTLQEVISHCFGHSEDVLGSFGWRWLVKNFKTIEVENRKDIDLEFSRNISNIRTPDYVSEAELDSYRYIHPYMYERGLTDDIIELFDIGYDKATQCLTFPIRDINGNTLFIARRSVKTKYFNYPAGAEKPLYGLYELSKFTGENGNSLSRVVGNGNVFVEIKPNINVEEVIVCESMLDCLKAWTFGAFAIALNGLGNELQFEQLRKLPCRKLILATDNDERGMQARKRIRRNVSNKLITEFIIPHIKRDNGKITKDLNDLERDEFLALEEIF